MISKVQKQYNLIQAHAHDQLCSVVYPVTLKFLPLTTVQIKTLEFNLYSNESTGLSLLREIKSATRHPEKSIVSGCKLSDRMWQTKVTRCHDNMSISSDVDVTCIKWHH